MLEQKINGDRYGLRWEGLLFFLALIAIPAWISSCGSSSTTTTTTPTITVTCTPTSVTVLGTSQCTATVLNLSSTLVNWSVSGTGTGSISTGGMFTAPSTVPTNNVVTITATSQVQSTLTATASLTIQQPTAISAVTCVDSSSATNTPASTVSSGNHLSCSATTATGSTVPVNWSVTNKTTPSNTVNLGSISAQGIYTAPLVPPAGQAITITATSQALATETLSVNVIVVFGNAVLNGAYVFSSSGRLPNITNPFWSRVGTFQAGGGTLVGIEDTNQGGTANTVTTQRSFSGAYSIGPDGRGTMQFCEGSGSSTCPQGSNAVTASFRIVVISPQQAQIIESSLAPSTSATVAAGGEILAQSPLISPQSGNLSGTYSFSFSGVTSAAAEESVVGEFAANGFGTIGQGIAGSPGQMDSSVSGNAFIAGTTYSIGANGRGTVTLNGLNFSFYPVSPSRVKFIEIDPARTPTTASSILLGDAYKQQTSTICQWGMNALSGATVFETSGTNAGGAIADLGSFTVPDTSGNFTGASLDENSGGTIAPLQLGTLSGTYAIGAQCGRGTLSIGAHMYVFYIISASSAVVQEITSGTVAHGLLLPSQGGPFTSPLLNGSYAFRLSGTDVAGVGGHQEDFLGQVTSTGLGTGLAGNLDLNDFGATQTGLGVANGMYSATGGLRATLLLPVNTAPATTRTLVMYMVSPTLFYVLDVDPNPAGTAIGTINNQF